MPQVAIVEIGGTVGDIESLPFLEAIRQMSLQLGRNNTCFIHLTLVPFIPSAGEIKTKPTQHSVKELREIGIQPDIVLCRADRAIPEDEKRKIALFTNVEERAVISAVDVDCIYKIPGLLHAQGLDDIVCRKLEVQAPPADLSRWDGARAHAGAPAYRGQYRPGRQVRGSDRIVQVAVRGADPCRHPQPGAHRYPLHRLRAHRAGRRRLPARQGRRAGAGRLRQARRRRQDRGDPLRAREQGPVPGHLPRPAARGDRVRAPSRRTGRRAQHRVRPEHAAPGDRIDPRVARPRWTPRGAQRPLRSGRHHAAGRPGMRAPSRQPRAADLRPGEGRSSGTATATRSTTATSRS